MAYYINQNGQNFGPYTIGQLRSMWHAGQLTSDTLYCEEGYSHWLPLADAFDTPRQRPPLKKARFRKSLVAGGVIVVIFIFIRIWVGLLSSGSESVATIQRPPPPPKASVNHPTAVLSQPATPTPLSSDVVTEEYARRINTFADKWDMTVQEVMRWDYVLRSRGLTLDDFNEALTRLEQSRDAALGYKPDIPKRHPNTPHLVAGQPIPHQDPTLTEKEKDLVKTLKLAGY